MKKWICLAMLLIGCGEDEPPPPQSALTPEQIAQLGALAGAVDEPRAPAMTIEVSPTHAGMVVCRHDGDIVCAIEFERNTQDLYVGGDVGTRFEINGEELTLSDADAVPIRARADLRRRGFQGISSKRASREMPLALDNILQGDIGGICNAGAAESGRTLDIAVTLPDGTRGTFAWPLSWADVARFARREISRQGAELPPATGYAILGRCDADAVHTLADLRYTTTSTESTRESSCGRYRDANGREVEIKRIMTDLSLSIREIRSGRVVASTTLRAETPDCPDSTHVADESARAARITSEPSVTDVSAWFDAEVARMRGDH